MKNSVADRSSNAVELRGSIHRQSSPPEWTAREDTAWIHLDMAGPGNFKDGFASGYGVALLNALYKAVDAAAARIKKRAVRTSNSFLHLRLLSLGLARAHPRHHRTPRPRAFHRVSTLERARKLHRAQRQRLARDGPRPVRQVRLAAASSAHPRRRVPRRAHSTNANPSHDPIFVATYPKPSVATRARPPSGVVAASAAVANAPASAHTRPSHPSTLSPAPRRRRRLLRYEDAPDVRGRSQGGNERARGVVRA